MKLSDLGISQFAATQGARGLVGTPGFMAPEILKYHGKEVLPIVHRNLTHVYTQTHSLLLL